MDSAKKRMFFVAVIAVLAVIIVIASVVVLLKGPRETLVEPIGTTETGELEVNDLYEGKMTIPNFNIPKSTYKPDSFVESNGVITYEDGETTMGINVNSKLGEVDWQKVKDSGVNYVMIRVGYRGNERGKISPDENFKANIEGALEVGLPVGVYFYSKAVTDAEAEEEATFVLEQIKGYSVTYPIAFYWEYDRKSDGTVDENSRTVRCNGEQVTGFTEVFCGKIESSGFDASFYCDKSMGYESLDLSRLTNFDMWYAEFHSKPSFYYDFAMWQYTKEGTVPGVSGSVPITICLKEYE